MVKKALAQLCCIKKSRSLAAALVLGALGLSAVAIMVAIATPSGNETAPVAQLFEKLESQSQLPALLSTRDQQLYRDMFAAQKRANWQEADAHAADLTNRALLGHVLAQRYLHDNYRSSPDELEAWLEKYSDHPQAHDIYTLALRKNPGLKITSLPKQVRLAGYGDDNGLARWSSNNASAETWRHAIDAWRRGNTEQAAKLFGALAADKDLHEWKQSASAFWAWRSYKALGNTSKAYKHLHMAASHPRTFYGILALQKLGQPLALDTEPEALSDADILEVMGEKAIRRIISLSRIGATDLADSEIRHLFPTASVDEKRRLLAIASELNLASAQIAMARHMATQARTLDFARYPIPAWQPHSGFRVDPALIYAMARQESGFHNNAVSNAGASGVMQLMPHTVSLMKKRALRGNTHSLVQQANASEASANVTLGQGYIEHLLDTPLVENNLLFLLTAYNAGPGRLQQWKKSIEYRNDPLLFIESIPFGETRSYVQQVMTNYWIYSEMIGNRTHSRQALLKNQWPDYEPWAAPVAVASTSGHAG